MHVDRRLAEVYGSFDTLLQVTPVNTDEAWQERVALRWQADTLDPAGSVPFNREGWGICSAGDQVLTSDGSSELVQRDPATLAPAGLIRVRLDGSRVDGLNDLDFSAGRVWANLAGRPFLAGIDPATGEVTDLVDAGAAWERIRGDPQAIGNGIAALPDPGEFLLTGKRWHSCTTSGWSRRGRGRTRSGCWLTEPGAPGRTAWQRLSSHRDRQRDRDGQRQVGGEVLADHVPGG